MSWICRYCETENSDNSRNCEVCGKSKDLSSEPFEGNHITCKGIAITGSKEELLNKFSAKGFVETHQHCADLIGPFAGFDNVYLYVNYDDHYDSVVSITFKIYHLELQDPIEIYEELKGALRKKYPSRTDYDYGDLKNNHELSSRIRRGEARRETEFKTLNGSIVLSINCSGRHKLPKIQLTYADDINYYIQKEIRKKEEERLKEIERQRKERERRLRAYENDL